MITNSPSNIGKFLISRTEYLKQIVKCAEKDFSIASSTPEVPAGQQKRKSDKQKKDRLGDYMVMLKHSYVIHQDSGIIFSEISNILPCSP